jgi:hypothetical protein
VPTNIGAEIQQLSLPALVRSVPWAAPPKQSRKIIPAGLILSEAIENKASSEKISPIFEKIGDNLVSRCGVEPSRAQGLFGSREPAAPSRGAPRLEI